MNNPRPRPSRKRREPIPKSPREVALEALYAVDRRHAFSDRLLHKLLRDHPMDPRDAAMVTNIVRGTLRWQGRIDGLLNHFIKIGLDALPPMIQNILRMGVFQMLYMDRIPPSAAVDESVKLAKKFGHPGTAGLVNAVLRKMVVEKDNLPEPRLGDNPAPALATIYSHPEWMVSRWLRRFGLDETRELLDANNTPPPVTIRVNPNRTTRDEFLKRLHDMDLTAEIGEHHANTIRVNGDFAPASVSSFHEGLFTVQDESESMVVDLLGPKPGELVVDLCAAPGGKTSQISELVGKKGLVIAVEGQKGRLKPLCENQTRMALTNAALVLADGRNLVLNKPVDRVLVDAPCSGLGVLAKRADARWRKTEASVRSIAVLQAELLKAGAALVRPGGVLVYSVCSMEPEEGDQQIKRFLAEHPDWQLDDAAAHLPAVMVTDGMMLILPHRHKMDGAFAARLLRKA
ncbi:MAG: 16S rRNA (cytosine(967)-C(5))-methyltransferase RsmB [Candidatus Eisenbacteria bacterium]|nr:16S rRNA (cytosine(967)-C(5))-methyltransferase RsmB [Candidatus Eisenbacteria bacterium]